MKVIKSNCFMVAEVVTTEGAIDRIAEKRATREVNLTDLRSKGHLTNCSSVL